MTQYTPVHIQGVAGESTRGLSAEGMSTQLPFLLCLFEECDFMYITQFVGEQLFSTFPHQCVQINCVGTKRKTAMYCAHVCTLAVGPSIKGIREERNASALLLQ